MANGGTPPYQYFWNTIPAQNTATANNLTAGTYQAMVIDANGCMQNISVSINEPTPLVLNTSVIDVLCNGENNGSASVYVNGGTPPYSYFWNNNVQTSINNNLSAGAYSVVVTDANACSANTTIQVNEPDPLIVVASSDITICIGDTAILSANASGGSGVLNLIWSNGLGAGNNHQIVVGQQTTYGVYALDANGCTSPPDSMTINVIDIALVNITTSNDTDICEGSSAVLMANYIAPPGNYTVN